MSLEQEGVRKPESSMPIPALGRDINANEFKLRLDIHPLTIVGANRDPQGRRDIFEKIEHINLHLGTYAILARENGDWRQHDNATIERAVLRALLLKKAG